VKTLDRQVLAAAMHASTTAIWEELATHPRVRRPPRLDAATVENLLRYLDVLLLWRDKTSLVSTSDPLELVNRHIADCLALLPFIGPGSRLADLGSGAGLPGLVLAIAAPDLSVLLVEPRRKRVNFLLEAVRATAATNCRVVPLRADKVAEADASDIDVVVSRAFGPLDSFLAASAHLLPATAKGRLIAMKGPKGPEEALALGGKPPIASDAHYQLCDGTPRVLLIYDQF